MTPEIIAQLRVLMQSQPRSLKELHRAAATVGSSWSEDQVALLLECLPDVQESSCLFRITSKEQVDPVTEALLQIVGDVAVPAAALVRQLPRGLIVSPAGLCEAARRHPLLEVVQSNRIRRR